MERNFLSNDHITVGIIIYSKSIKESTHYLPNRIPPFEHFLTFGIGQIPFYFVVLCIFPYYILYSSIIFAFLAYFLLLFNLFNWFIIYRFQVANSLSKEAESW